MRAPSGRTRRIISLSAAPVAVLLAGLMVWQGSNAAFSSKAYNSGNSWQTGSVALSTDGASAMFQVQNLVPMQTGSRCIVVTANSSVPGLVKTYFEDLSADGLEDYIKLGVQEGTGGSFGSCDEVGNVFAPGVGFHASETLADLATTAGMNHSDYAHGILPWDTTGVTAGESRTYKFTWVFDTAGLTQDAIDGLQGKAATLNINWELQNDAP